MDTGQAGLGEEERLEMGPDLTKATPGMGPGRLQNPTQRDGKAMKMNVTCFKNLTVHPGAEPPSFPSASLHPVLLP